MSESTGGSWAQPDIDSISLSDLGDVGDDSSQYGDSRDRGRGFAGSVRSVPVSLTSSRKGNAGGQVKSQREAGDKSPNISIKSKILLVPRSNFFTEFQEREATRNDHAEEIAYSLRQLRTLWNAMSILGTFEFDLETVQGRAVPRSDVMLIADVSKVWTEGVRLLKLNYVFLKSTAVEMTNCFGLDWGSSKEVTLLTQAEELGLQTLNSAYVSAYHIATSTQELINLCKLAHTVSRDASWRLFSSVCYLSYPKQIPFCSTENLDQLLFGNVEIFRGYLESAGSRWDKSNRDRKATLRILSWATSRSALNALNG